MIWQSRVVSSVNIKVAFLRGINVGGHRVEGKELVAALRYEVPVILRSADELRDLAASQPFGEDEIAIARTRPRSFCCLRSHRQSLLLK